MALSKEKEALEQAEKAKKEKEAQEKWQAFWSPSTLFPVASNERFLSLKQFFLLGLAIATPLNALFLFNYPFEPLTTYIAILVATILATLLMVPLAKVSQAYGLGSSILLSGLLGQNGAKIVSTLRAIWGVAFFAEITMAMALTASSLLVARWPALNILHGQLAGFEFSLPIILLAGGFLALQYFILNKGLTFIGKWLPRAVIAALSGLLILTIWVIAAPREASQPLPLNGQLPCTLPDFSKIIFVTLMFLTPFIFSSPDYFRYSKNKVSAAPWLVGAGLCCGQTIMLAVKIFLGSQPASWLFNTYQPLISWLCLLAILVGMLFFNLLYNGYPAILSLALLKPNVTHNLWQKITVFAALPLYFTLTFCYSSEKWQNVQLTCTVFFWCTTILLIFYYSYLKKYRFNQSKLFYQPPSFTAGIKVKPAIILCGALLLTMVVILPLNYHSPANILSYYIFLWLPLIALIAQLSSYYLPGIIKSSQDRRLLAKTPLDRRPTPVKSMALNDPRAGSNQPEPLPMELSQTELVARRMRQRQLEQQAKEEAQKAREQKGQKLQDNVKSWLE